MEDIRRAAKAEYATYTEEEKRGMESEFRSMDKDGDGKIDLREFMARSAQHTQSFFRLLDQNNDDFLDFDEFTTLCYINSSDMPFCAACKEFILARFFTCTQCRFASKTEAKTFDLCSRCHERGSFEHEHTEFVDSTRLPKPQAKRRSRTNPSQSGQPRPRRRTRMKAAMKKNLRRIGKLLSAAATAAGLAVSLDYLMSNNTGGEGGGGGDEDYDHDEDYDDGDAGAYDPSHF